MIIIRRILQIMIIIGIASLSVGCTPLVCAGIAVAMPLISHEIQKHGPAQRTKRNGQSQFQKRKNERVRLEEKRYVRYRAETIRRQHNVCLLELEKLFPIARNYIAKQIL